MRKRRHLVILMGFLVISNTGFSQRNYTPHSVLSTGDWFMFSVSQAGIYKIDLALLQNLGVNTANLSSSSIRIFGNGGAMLPEANQASRPDDLVENGIQVIDGGDGMLNGSDYLIFYAPGPNEWTRDSINQRFRHRKNIYSDKAFYFLNIGSNGKRVVDNPSISTSTISVNNFSERYYHELDTVNFLSGSKEWYGEELSALPGRSLTRNFPIPIQNMQLTSPLFLHSNLVSRSVGSQGRIDIKINNQPVAQVLINAVTGGQYDVFAQAATTISSGLPVQNNNEISYTYVPGSFNAQGWINWFEIFARRNLSMHGSNQLFFRDWLSVGNASVTFILQHAEPNTIVWDITNPLNPLRMQVSLNGTELRFSNEALQLHEYIGFNTNNFLTPLPIGKMANQDLHGGAPVDYIIVSYPLFQAQAQRLASLHTAHAGLRTLVVTTEQVFNEFSSGIPDPTAIRDFIKMYYDKYGSNPTNKIKYLLLFGDASFDYKNRIANNTNFVPAYQNGLSLDPLSSYTSDDYFGFLDTNEDINSGVVTNLLDIGIGRVPARTNQEAKQFVDKIAAYISKQSFGAWRNNLSFIADDEDNNLHFHDAEILTSTAAGTAPQFNQQKIYLDAFKQESGAGGSSYPQAVLASNNQVYNGTLVWNYNGHGGARRLAEETILDQQMVNSWNNSFRLPLFITATCDFAPYDNPMIQSLGEDILLRPASGAIALMTTTRVVFAFSNRIMNDNYLRIALQPDALGRYKSLGEAVKEAKNFTYQSSGDITNNRKFSLLGDPALTLGFPTLRTQITRVNGIVAANRDTLSAGEITRLEGIVTDQQGNLLNAFNGSATVTVFDKPQTIQTLANDPGSQPVSFQTQTTILFKGNATVNNGAFSFNFKMPKDINYQYGAGRISLYATDSSKDGNGLFSNFLVGGISGTVDNDHEGPEIRSYLNDELFVSGGITDQHPVLIVKLTDSSGINTTGTGIGHELVATLDNDNRNYFILNDFYQAELNSYQKGAVRFQLPELSPGAHTIKIKAWDVLNNSNEMVLDFIVAKDEELQISHVLNYPNPFSSSTQFWFEHNKPGQNLEVQVQVFTISGKIIKSIRRIINTVGNRAAELDWDGRDEEGEKPGRGVYFYQLKVTSPDRKTKTVTGKLVIL